MTDDTAAQVVEQADRQSAMAALYASIYWACKGPTPSIKATAMTGGSPFAYMCPSWPMKPLNDLQHNTIMFRAALRLNIIDPLTGQEMAGNA
jgi:hypothetical protein